jgi:type II secretory pathway pseudopilin PulG
MLLTVAILGILARAALPGLASGDDQKMQVAAEETANTLRFALSEAKRTGGYVLVDGESTSDHLFLYYSDGFGNQVGAIIDPLTKRAVDLNVRNNPFSQGVRLTPQFRAGGSAQPQLLIGPGLSQLQGWVDDEAEGALQANSGVLLSYNTLSTLVSLNPVTGLVTLP